MVALLVLVVSGVGVGAVACGLFVCGFDFVDLFAVLFGFCGFGCLLIVLL